MPHPTVLSPSMEILTAVSNEISEGVVIFSPDGDILHINDTARTWLRLKQGLKKIHALDLLKNVNILTAGGSPLAPQDNPISKLLGGEEFHKLNLRLQDSDLAELGNFQCSGRVILGESPCRLLTLQKADEITGTVHTVGIQASLVGILGDLLATEIDASFYQRVLKGAISIIPGAQAGSITLYNEADHRYHFVAAVGYKLKKLQQISFTYNEALFLVPESKENSFIVQNLVSMDRVMLDPERYRVLQQEGRIDDIKVTLMTPIRLSGKIVATLLLDNMSDPKAFNKESQLIAEAFGMMVGIALKHLNYKAKLAQAAEQFTQLFHANPTAMLLVELDKSQVLDANEALLKMLELKSDAVIGKPFDSLIKASRQSLLKQAIKLLKEGEASPPTEIQLYAKSHSYWVLSEAQPINFKGKNAALFSFMNISEQKETEEQLMQAIQTVLQNTTWLGQSIMEQLARIRNKKAVPASFMNLSKREKQVLNLIAKGQNNAQIATELHLAEQTVRNYIARIYQKLAVNTRAEAIVWAREHGF